MVTKTNWVLNEIVTPDDMNRIEQNIKDLDTYTSEATTINTIEASDSKIIDFNTLTTEGIYIIKNATSTTTTNSPSLGSSGNVVLEVGSKDDVIYQSAMTISNNGIPYHRQYSAGAWSSWLYTINPNVIRAGNLNSGMTCNTPTADTQIANKKYVDDEIKQAKFDANYNSLSNRPQINGQLLTGNLSDSALNLQRAITYATYTLQSNAWLNGQNDDFYYLIQTNKITKNHIVNISMDLENQEKLTNGYTRTDTNYLYIYTTEKPTSNVVVNLEIILAKEDTL